MPRTKRVFVPIHEGDIRADAPYDLSEECATCTHARHSLTCEAFPDGIPEAIASGKVSHVEPYPGDGGIRYEPIGER